MSEHKKVVSLSELPELRERLTGKTVQHEPTKAEHLYLLADTVLDDDEAVVKHRIPGGLARVSRYACESNDNGTTYYARLARYESSRENEVSDTFILFDESADAGKISVRNPRGIDFKQYTDGSIALFMNRGTEPIAQDDPAYEKYLAVAEEIIGAISDQHTAHLNSLEAEKEAKKHRVRKGIGRVVKAPINYFTESERRFASFTTKGEFRRRWAIGLVALAGISYGHLFFDDHPDAKIGDVPMPYPIEWFVDWGNMPDHRAAGFNEPDGALEIAYGQPVGEIPILENYRTDGVPDTSMFTDMGGVYQQEVAKPGLWESNFDENYHPETGTRGRDAHFVDGCYTIEGDFNPGQTKIFSQTEGINKMITLDMPNSWTLEVCEKDNAPDDFQGSIFLWQDPSER